MDEDKSPKTDLDIASEFDRLFNEIPEPDTDEKIKAFLEEAGYDVEKLKADGAMFINDLISKNWRFANLRKIHGAVAEINEVPLRKGWDRQRLTAAIKKTLAALSTSGEEPALAFRNLGELTDADLAAIFQELEYKAHSNGITLNLDL